MVESVSATESERLYDAARLVLPGGVSAAARFHPALGRPFFAARGRGSRIWDVDGREYVDFHISFGAALLGHGHPAITAAVQRALDIGVLCAFETPYHEETARKLTQLVPCAEMVRFTGSGRWHAIRTARVFTGKWKVVKFEGHFHGFSDTLGFSSWPPLSEAGPAQAPATRRRAAGSPPRTRTRSSCCLGTTPRRSSAAWQGRGTRLLP